MKFKGEGARRMSEYCPVCGGWWMEEDRPGMTYTDVVFCECKE